ncbi:MAG: DUF177 domain-containing protein [Holophagales bacterium]|nr:DUF177 domain-containing protein [Holophagales bacterium]
MHLQLDQARSGPLRWRDAVRVPAPDLSRDEALVPGSVDCEGSLTFTGPDFLLQTRLHYRYRLRCDRSLAPYEEDVDLALAFVVTAGGSDGSAAADDAGEGPGARELEPEDLSTLVAVAGAVDLCRLVCEQVELNVPMKPTCDSACRGLCPQCGVDRNRQACNCVAESVDPRWAALEAVRERITDSLT